MARFSPIVFLALSVFSTMVYAQHLDPSILAEGEPEKILASIHLDQDNLSSIKQKYGEPIRVAPTPGSSLPYVVPSCDYYWTIGEHTLRVLIMRHKDLIRPEMISCIEVEGPPSNSAIATTGSGLALGDDLQTLRKIYGKKYWERIVSKLDIHDVSIEWKIEAYSLVACFDNSGHINKLSIYCPE